MQDVPHYTVDNIVTVLFFHTVQYTERKFQNVEWNESLFTSSMEC